VEGVVFEQLALSSAGGVWSLATSGGTPLVVDSGIVGGGMDVLNTNLADFRTRLDELARGIVERVNAIHVTGTSPLGATGVSFFEDFGDPTTVTARSFALDAAVAADASAVAAGTPDGGGNYRSGANDVALAMANLRDATTGGVLDGSSINGAYRDLVASVGLTTASARESAASHDVLRTSANERRTSVFGVATDEELIKVVQLQAGYTAAARLVTVVDEMYQALLSV
jgi:flagellar hook-associated protein 1 FlgK